MPDRTDALKALLSQDPQNSRFRYMLATELVNAGSFESAIAEFNTLLDIDPDYVPGWFHAGRTAEQMGQEEDARTYYRRGIDAARRTGDQHSLSELQAALDILG